MMRSYLAFYEFKDESINLLLRTESHRCKKIPLYHWGEMGDCSGAEVLSLKNLP